MNTQTLIAYNGDQRVKDKFIRRMQAHMDADELVRGTGFDNGRGCAVGCILNKYQHEAFPDELGLPVWSAYLLDKLHENTSDSVWPTLSLRFLSSIRPGADIEPVRNEIILFILRRNRARVEALPFLDTSIRTQIIVAVDQCILLHKNELAGVIDLAAAESAAWSAAWSAARSARSAESGESVARSAAWSAESAAWTAAESAAWTAAESAAWSAARSARSAESSALAAAESVAWSAESAAWTAAWSAEYDARSVAEYDAIAEEFIRLLSAR